MGVKHMATIYNRDGNTITEGLQGCDTCDEAVQAARRIAKDRNQTVYLEDDDGFWAVPPRGKITATEW